MEPGALVLDEKSQAKAEAFLSLDFPCESTEEPFSLGRGLILGQRFFKLSIVLSFDVNSCPETTKATRWVALAWSCYAASCLARAPLSEGESGLEPAPVIDG